MKAHFAQIGQATRVQKKRLVTHDQELRLRGNLRRKIKQVVEDPASVPMEIFYRITSYDPKIFKKFLALSKDLKKHLLFHCFDTTRDLSHAFTRKYGQLLTLESRFLTLTPISFGSEEGSRLDLTLRVYVKPDSKKIQGQSVIISNRYNLEKIGAFTDSKIEGEYQTQYQFDLFKSNSTRWLWLHKDESLVSINSSSNKFIYSSTDTQMQELIVCQ